MIPLHIRCPDCYMPGLNQKGQELSFYYHSWSKSLCYSKLDLAKDQWLTLMAKSFVTSKGKTYRLVESKWEIKEEYKWLSSKPTSIPTPEDLASQFCNWSDLYKVVTLLFDKKLYPCNTCRGTGMLLNTEFIVQNICSK